MNIELNKERFSICSICLEQINDKEINLITILLDCNHKYHQKCINKWLQYKKYTCPYCRNNIYGVQRYTTIYKGI